MRAGFDASASSSYEEEMAPAGANARLIATDIQRFLARPAEAYRASDLCNGGCEVFTRGETEPSDLAMHVGDSSVVKR